MDKKKLIELLIIGGLGYVIYDYYFAQTNVDDTSQIPETTDANSVVSQIDDITGDDTEDGSYDYTGQEDTTPVQTATGGDADTLARTMYGEARNQGAQGLQAVANVVMNRYRDPRFPKTVSGVCLQANQFSCWNATDPNRTVILAVTASNSIFAQCQSIAAQAIAGTLPDITGGAEYYFNPSVVTPSWAAGMRHTVTIGAHSFYSDGGGLIA